MAISGKKVFIPKPPDKGSFPLDHDSECKHVMLEYLQCLNQNNNHNTNCRQLSKDYLQCRMDKHLMAREEWPKLGFDQQQQHL